jgi:hypothetical protein
MNTYVSPIGGLLQRFPPHIQNIWREAFDSALAQYRDQSKASEMAWAAIKNKYRYCHSCHYSPWIFIDVGNLIQTGSGLAPHQWTSRSAPPRLDPTIAHGTVRGGDSDGTVSVWVGGDVYADLAPEELLRNNPRLLVGQRVRHPHPPSTSPAAGWVVNAIDEPSATVSLAREQVHSSAAVEEVVRHNIEELRTRIVVLPEED